MKFSIFWGSTPVNKAFLHIFAPRLNPCLPSWTWSWKRTRNAHRSTTFGSAPVPGGMDKKNCGSKPAKNGDFTNNCLENQWIGGKFSGKKFPIIKFNHGFPADFLQTSPVFLWGKSSLNHLTGWQWSYPLLGIWTKVTVIDFKKKMLNYQHLSTSINIYQHLSTI